MQMPRPLPIASMVFAVALTLFLVRIDVPNHPYFDEVHYVPAAREMVAAAHRPTLNREHPPLGKALIAAGIAVFGDNPFGWRVMSAAFGALTLTLLYLWALALFADPAPALWATIIGLADQFLYVQSRIAMLDVFVAGFVFAAFAAFTATWREGANVRWLMLTTTICLGLAAACKWSALLAAGLWFAIVVIVAILRQWRARFDAPNINDWFRSDLWADMRARDWFACALAPAFVYVITFIPVVGWSLPEFLHRQVDMWHDLATLSVASHPYASAWTSWPVLARPIWYLFEPAPASPGAFMAVVCLGNPVVFWAGIPALFACLIAFIRTRDRAGFLICVCYAGLYLGWALVPRGLGFLYYYFPAGLVVGPALAFAFYRTALVRFPLLRWLYLVAALACFAYFLPITSAPMTVTIPTYKQLMWFASWP